MTTKLDLKLIIPLIILTLITGGGIYYYQNNYQDEKNVWPFATNFASNDQTGVILGDQTNTNNTSDKITDGQTYTAKISEIRLPINQGFQDLSEKAKYTTLFSQEEIQKIIDDTKKSIQSGIDTLKDLAIDEKFRTANDQHLKSLNLLLDAINSYNSARQQTDKKEAQRLSELYSYDIEQSNNILKTIQIPN